MQAIISIDEEANAAFEELQKKGFCWRVQEECPMLRVTMTYSGRSKEIRQIEETGCAVVLVEGNPSIAQWEAAALVPSSIGDREVREIAIISGGQVTYNICYPPVSTG